MYTGVGLPVELYGHPASIARQVPVSDIVGRSDAAHKSIIRRYLCDFYEEVAAQWIPHDSYISNQSIVIFNLSK